MSIIHDALKKVQGTPDTGLPGKTPSGRDKPGTTLKGSSILVAVAVAVGILALGVLAWRVGMLSKGAATQDGTPTPRNIPSAMTTTVPTAKSAAPHPNPAIDRTKNLAMDAQRYLRIGDLSAAEKEYRQALALSGGNRAEMANNLAVVLRKEGKLKEALSLYNRSLAENPRYAEALNNRAVVFRRMKRYQEAERDLEKALTLVPGYAVAQANLAIVFEAAGRKKAAVAAYRKYLGNPARRPGLEEDLIRRRVSLIEDEIAGLELRKGAGDSSGSVGR